MIGIQSTTFYREKKIDIQDAIKFSVRDSQQNNHFSNKIWQRKEPS